MDIWRFQAALSQRLQAWAGLSVGAGLLLGRLSDPLWQGFGAQTAGWGLVNAAIALFGSRAAARRRRALPDPEHPDVLSKEAAGLERLLWVNSGLDVLYVTGGLVLVATRGRDERRAAGHGWGIVLQGVFLFFFDLLQAMEIRRERQPAKSL